MAAWLIPALKAVLPHVATIISAAAPVFTKRKTEAAVNQALLQQQIAELQQAASENAAHIKELAAQLQSTVAALEQAAAIAEAKLRRALLLCIAAAILSALSLCVVLFRM
jgi:chromosome segregation ATPase